MRKNGGSRAVGPGPLRSVEWFVTDCNKEDNIVALLELAQ